MLIKFHLLTDYKHILCWRCYNFLKKLIGLLIVIWLTHMSVYLQACFRTHLALVHTAVLHVDKRARFDLICINRAFLLRCATRLRVVQYSWSVNYV